MTLFLKDYRKRNIIHREGGGLGGGGLDIKWNGPVLYRFQGKTCSQYKLEFPLFPIHN